jgi:serine/threonine protein kinase/dipeptidyl aminopeptidase/acylaminoacyl peptidase
MRAHQRNLRPVLFQSARVFFFVLFPMTIAEGTRLGRYEIRGPVGAGGMGEVYMAQDVRLGRTVALKILPEGFSQDQQRMRRFEQEAHAAVALNHPNVTHIYEVEEEAGYHFIAMEYVEGETLRQRMTASPLSLHDALEIAQQVGAALTAAHAAGIIHRDIKPENVMIRRDGYVKVLDFGLAKLTEQQGETDTEAPTKALVNTGPGMVMGTARYMSPEQARGLDVDARTDLWSLGVVLYECVAGRPPFEGSSASDVITAILSKEPPPLARYARDVPESLEWIVTKALTKDREERYQTAREMMFDLKRVKQRLDVEAEIERSVSPDSLHLSSGTRSGASSSSSATTLHEEAVSSSSSGGASTTAQVSAARTNASSAEYIAGEMKRHKTGLLLALVGLGVVAIGLVLALVGYGVYRMSRQPLANTGEQASRQTGTRPDMKISRLTSNGKTRNSGISPDGKYAVYVMEAEGKDSIWVRQISTSSNVQIVPPVEDTFYGGPVFSRDGEYVYYVFSDKSTPQGVLYQIPVLGGTPRKILTNIGSGITFSPDGKRFAFVRNDNAVSGEDQLMIANADGTNERQLTARKGDSFFNYSGPSWSPDGKTIACGAGSYKGGFHHTMIAVDAETGEQKEFTTQQWQGIGRVAWLADGRSMVLTGNEKGSIYSQIWLLSYPEGSARKITNDLNNYGAVSLTADSATLLTTQSEAISNIWIAPGTDVARAKQITTGRNGLYGTGGMVWTPDGRLIYASPVNGNQDIWIMNADGSNQKQLTTDPQPDYAPTISPDGRYIIFVSNRAGMPSIWRMDTDGGNQTQLTNGQEDYLPQVSPDGQWIVFHSWRSGKQAVWKMPFAGGEPVQLTDKFTYNTSISPDGKLIACGLQPEEPGALQRIALLPIEGGEFTKTMEIPTTASVFSLHWSNDGKAILYRDTRLGVTNIWSMPVDGGAAKQLTDYKEEQIFWFEWSRDGRQLAIARGSNNSDVVLISNFR